MNRPLTLAAIAAISALALVGDASAKSLVAPERAHQLCLLLDPPDDAECEAVEVADNASVETVLAGKLKAPRADRPVPQSLTQ